MKVCSQSVRQTKLLADLFARELKQIAWSKPHALVVALKGDLGSGKTTFSKALAHTLGVRSPVHSPTFVLMKRYPIRTKSFRNLWHIDCYRIDSIRELNVIGFRNLMSDPNNILLIEWGDKIKSSLPRSIIYISFTHRAPHARDILFSA